MTRIKERYPGSLSGSGFPLRRGCRGLTLVELMISLVLSLLLAAAMVQLFIGNKQTFRMQEAVLPWSSSPATCGLPAIPAVCWTQRTSPIR